MSKGIFITATGTDMGKTYITALIVKKLAESGVNAGYYKAALSGAEERNGMLIPGDAAHVKEVATIEQDLGTMVSYVYKASVSPHLAARIEGNPVDLDTVRRDFKSLCGRYDYITADGSGGIVCPIRVDEQTIFLEDIIKTLNLPGIIVADGGLGTINSVVLTAEYMKQKEIPVKGIILNNYDAQSLMHRDNREMIERLTGIPVIAAAEHGCKDLDIDAEFLKSLYEEV